MKKAAAPKPKVTKVAVSGGGDNDFMDIDGEEAVTSGNGASQNNGEGGSKKASEQYQKVGIVYPEFLLAMVTLCTDFAHRSTAHAVRAHP